MNKKVYHAPTIKLIICRRTQLLAGSGLRGSSQGNPGMGSSRRAMSFEEEEGYE